MNIAKTSAQLPCTLPGGPTLCQKLGSEPADITISANTLTSSLPYTSWDTKIVHINGVVTVNSAFTINNSIVRFGAGGGIVVVTGGDFHSTDAQYFGCANTGWAGIRAEGGTTIFGSGNQVEDAQVGITIASSNAFLAITDNIFNRNKIDILVLSQVSANAFIIGNLFDVTSPNFDGTSANIGVSAAANSTVFVGLPFATDIKDKNTFQNHKWGGSGVAANMNFRYSVFKCNTVGLHTFGGRLDVRGSNTYRNLFLHNKNDIYTSGDFNTSTNGSNLFVAGSDFRECLEGNILSLENTNAQSIFIGGGTNPNAMNYFEIDNSGTNSKIGIRLDRASGGNAGIPNNIILNQYLILPWTTGKARSAIKIVGQPGTADEMRMSENAISINAGGTVPLSNPLNSPMIDVTINQAGSYTILNNIMATTNVDAIDHRNRWGFYLHDAEMGTPLSNLLWNSVLGTAQGYDHGMCAFHFDKSGPLRMCHNRSDFTLRGFHFTGNCGVSVFAANQLGHHSRSNAMDDPSEKMTGALQMELGSNIGPQGCRHNIWDLGNYAPDRGGWHKDNQGAINSRFDYNPALVGEEPNPVQPLDDWFYPLCMTTPVGYCEEMDNKTSLDEDETKIIQQNLTFTTPSNAINWEQRRGIIAKLIRYPALQTAYSDANTFYNVHFTTSAGKFAQFDGMLFNAMLISPGNMSSLTQIRDQINFWIGKVDSLDSTVPNSITARNVNSTFRSYRASLLVQIGLLMPQLANVEAQIETSRTTALAQCSTYLNSLPNSTNYESNQILLNGLAIKKAQRIAFSENDYVALRLIAAQCPADAGFTRERAMNLLPTGDAAIARPDIPYTPGCPNVLGEGDDRNNQSKPLSSVVLSPNPVTDLLMVHFTQAFSGDVEVFDLAGKSVMAKQSVLEQADISLGCSHLIPGIYLFSARSGAGERITLKFAISR